MQNRFVGDIGDFGKFGLLRWLCGMREVTANDGHRQLRLGMIWYLNNNGSNNEGEIEPPVELSHCDQGLFARLQRIRPARSIERVRKGGILPGSDFYERCIAPGSGRPAKPFRKNWLYGALAKTPGDELIFVDPDKGIASRNQVEQNSREHAFMDELKPFIERGQSLVIYQHAAHADREMLIMYLTLRLQRELGLTWVRTLRYHRGDRFFFIVIQPRHKNIIDARLESFRKSLWCRTPNVFTLYNEPRPSISLP